MGGWLYSGMAAGYLCTIIRKRTYMKTTIVIPNYNGIKYIKDCLESIYAGTVQPRVIVVDNASGDGSRELIEKQFPKVRLICFEENKGFCAAVNKGIREADTEYVLLLNNDTTVDRELTGSLEAAIESRINAFSVGAKMLSMSEPDIIDDAGDMYCALGWAYALGKGKSKRLYSREREIFAACAGAAIYRKSVFEDIGYFDENHFAYLEDIDIGYRAKIAGYRNYFSPDSLVLHAGSGVSGSRYNEFKVRLSSRNSVYLIYKNMPALQILLNLVFLIPGFFIKTLFFIKKGLGGIYIQGLLEGIRLCASEKGRRKKTVFQVKYSGNYVRIQLELWRNIILRLFG